MSVGLFRRSDVCHRRECLVGYGWELALNKRAGDSFPSGCNIVPSGWTAMLSALVRSVGVLKFHQPSWRHLG